MKFPDILKHLRKSENMNQLELANAIGVSRSTIGMYESGQREPDFETMEAIADYFNVSMDYLLGKSPDKLVDNIFKYDNISPVRLKRFPMLGEIACGEPIYAAEDKESYVMADMDIHADFCLIAKGDSMINARICDGDIVFIREMPIVENGEIAAVIIDDEATLKRWYYYKEDNKLMLVADNPKYAPLVYMNEELNMIRCLGKAVYFTSAL